MCEECAPYFPVARLIGRIIFVNYLGRVKDASSDNIQEIISLGGSFMCNYAAVCCGRMELKLFEGD